MRIAVCDDEKSCSELFVKYIKEHLVPQEEVIEASIDAYFSGEELLAAYNQGKTYDILFLDIRMKKISGFDAARSIRDINQNTVIIFITSLSEYIFSSFEYKPFWFLVKPVSEDKFKHVLTKAMLEVANNKASEYSFFTRENGLLSIEISKIIYLESVLRRIVIHTTCQQYSCYATIAAEEQKLIKHNFIRVHKGYLVNMAFIQRINKTNVVLKNSEVLPISEHRFKMVFDSFTSYLARCAV